MRALKLDVCVCVVTVFVEEKATDRSLHDRGANQLCSHHARWIGGHGPGVSEFFWCFFFVLVAVTSTLQTLVNSRLHCCIIRWTWFRPR